MASQQLTRVIFLEVGTGNAIGDFKGSSFTATPYLKFGRFDGKWFSHNKNLGQILSMTQAFLVCPVFIELHVKLPQNRREYPGPFIAHALI